jgi:hypothetical protein
MALSCYSQPPMGYCLSSMQETSMVKGQIPIERNPQ